MPSLMSRRVYGSVTIRHFGGGQEYTRKIAASF
jgi:hypothetical protein